MPPGPLKSQAWVLLADLFLQHWRMRFQAFERTTSYGVPYNTSVEFNKTIQEGAALTANHLRDQADHCPNQRFVLSGLSKGAMVMHSTKLENDIKSKVLAVLVFGDPWRPIGDFNNSWPIDSPLINLNPRNGTLNTENVISFCNVGDTICETGTADPNSIPLPHLVYPTDGSVGIAVAFVRSKVQQ
ncbi:unnamed protein product [Rhizoctonia solani]|uniref:Cutinase n=1 Tax=Rhizoctonia solani TaxID=456999 RepID=A0A8H3CI18_9AGAM|nr:unnamed protein product [Rhizoctonia solani]